MLLAASPFLGCSRVEKEVPTDWKSLALPGKSLELIDEKYVENYRFAEDGMAIATFGLKDGAVAGPIVYWKIEENRLVISIDPESEILQELVSPSIRGSVVTATRKSGAKAKYKFA